MARSTGPILATGTIALVNTVILNDEDMDWRVPIATGFAAGAFGLLEKANEDLAVGLAYVALVAVLFTRIRPNVPAPAESFVNFMEGN